MMVLDACGIFLMLALAWQLHRLAVEMGQAARELE